VLAEARCTANFDPAHVGSGSKPERLNASKCFPLLHR
jgi:hypothetical protein